MKILICGTGSIAYRHYCNLLKLGYKDIIFYKSTKKKIYFNKINNNKIFNDLDLALKENPKVAFICNVTSAHLKIASKCANKKINIFLEKPISNNRNNLNLFKKVVSKNKVKVFIGYMMRFHPLIQKIKKMIVSKKIKNIFYVSSIWGEYLPNWHKYEDYKKSYASSKKLGGGAALTLSHEIDLMSFLFGKIKSYSLNKNFNSSLKIKADISASYLIKFSNNIDCNINVNFLCNPPYRKLIIFSENLQLTFDYYKSSLKILTNTNKTKIVKIKKFKRNNLFLYELKYFFKELKKKNSNMNLNSSINLMKYIS